MYKSLVNRLVILAVFVPALVLAQSKKIEFSQTSFQQALNNAGKADKIIFVDCYTSWCIPCKNMAAHVFTVDSVATFFNSHFINLQIDMEKGEGPALQKKYRVEAYPSFLLINPDGSLLYKFVGAMSAAEFLGKVREGMSPNNQVADMNKRYEAGERQAAFIREYIKLKIRLMEISEGVKIASDYFNGLTDAEKVKPENWFLFGESRYAMYLSNVHTQNFTYLADHWKAFSPNTDKQEVAARLKTLYRRVAEYCLMGTYFKDVHKNVFPYKPEEFTQFRKQLLTMDWADKQEYMDLMDVAEACAQKDTLKTTKLLAQCFGKLSANNQKLIYTYWLAYDKYRMRDGNFGFRELLDTVSLRAKDAVMKNFADKLKKR